ncbi:LysR family transcriptional regulator [Vibrio aphrogenes]|uniref:LysR family transcriptional regulator n=1 Tax=Vibrio aphrogenes TaxID=1891186 RepID=UPI000B35274D|nr:LysR family transcriptional regulator [Vibrio aphrogenes]
MIKTEDLLAFLAVAENESFSKASAKENIQIATLSRAVARLEKQLETTLFNRTTRKLVMTEEGAVFKTYAQKAIQTLELGQQHLRSQQTEPVGKLRVDSAFPFMVHQIVPHLAEFERLYPNIELELTTNETVVDLLDNKVDVAIRIGDLKDSTLHARSLGRSPLKLVASPEYLDHTGEPKTVEALFKHKLIGFSHSSHLNHWYLKEVDEVPNFSLKASSGEVIKQLCLNGLGVCALSYYMIHKELDRGLLVEVLPEAIIHPNRRESIQAVYYKQSALASRISLFLDFIQDKLKLQP